MPVKYVTVYQISKGYPDWIFTCAEFLPLVIAIAIVIAKWRLGWRKLTWFHCVFIGVFALVASSLIPGSGVDSSAFDIYHKGVYSIVEGTVTDFQPMPYEGHQEECFTVQTERFCYSDYILSPGFRNTASHGGPIRSGLPVRIAYSDSTILRLDVAEDQVLTSVSSAATANLAQKEAEARLQSDPVAQRLNTAALFTGICWALWWNLQWKRVMRFWVKPPNRPLTQLLFRIFFALNLVGAIVQLIRQLHVHPLTQATIGPILLTTAIMCGVVSLMSFVVLWMAEQRGRKKSSTGILPPPPPFAS
jgi:hypothetical protein